MKITESKLRKIIRQLIKESDGGSHMWYPEWAEETESIMQGSLNKGAWDCLNDFGIGMRDANHFRNIVNVLDKFNKRGISEADLDKILDNIEKIPAADDHDMSKLDLEFTATIKLLKDKGKLKVNLKNHNKDELNQMKPGDMSIYAAAAASGNDRLQSCLIYVKPDDSTIDSSNYYVIDQKYFSGSGIYDREEAGNIRRYNEKQQADYLDRRERADSERARQNRKYFHI